MSVLVSYASAHSSTVEIAQQIADRLLKAGVAAVVRPVASITSIHQYRAVVLGSTLVGHEWLTDATTFLQAFADELQRVPVWLFSSAEVAEGDSPGSPPHVLVPLQDSAAVAHGRRLIRIRDHRQFASTCGRPSWSELRDLFLKICGGSVEARADLREINDWVHGIARELQAIDHARERRRLHLSVRGRP